jgi:hypothetical protein
MRLLLAALLLGSAVVEGFKLKTHMMTANKAMEAIVAPNGDVKKAYLGQLGSLAHVEVRCAACGSPPPAPPAPASQRATDPATTPTRPAHPSSSTSSQIRNPFVVDGVRRSPKFFRAGVCGPDCFPDLGQGQLLVHVNRGCERVDLMGLDAHKCFAASSLPFERRRLSAYRSVDYGMALLAEAWEWQTGTGLQPGGTRKTGRAWEEDKAARELLGRHGLRSREALKDYDPVLLLTHHALGDWNNKLTTPGYPTPGTVPAADVAPLRKLLLARQQAVVFAYGFLGHMIGDSFAHSYVNEWQRGAFDYFGGRGGSFGPLTEELKHVGVEGFIDHALPKMKPEELTIAAPKGFLNFLYRKTFFDRAATTRGAAVGDKADEVAGNFGGPFFTHLLSASATLEGLSDHRTWKGPDARRALKVMPSWMVQDVEYFLKVRGHVVEAMLEKWVHLSECVGQNIIQGANRHWDYQHARMERVESDACRQMLFEATRYEKELFEGTLDQAAWGTDYPVFFEGDRPSNTAPVADQLAYLAQQAAIQQQRAVEGFMRGMRGGGAKVVEAEDFGTLGGNLGKIFAFVKASAARFFRFNLIKDVKSIKELHAKVLKTFESCAPVINFGGCVKAWQAKLSKSCIFNEPLKCWGCPETHDKRYYECRTTAQKARCYVPGFWRCWSCSSSRRRAGKPTGKSPLCIEADTAANACLNPLCVGYEVVTALQNAVTKFVDMLVNRVLEKLGAAIRKKLLASYAGRQLTELKAVHDALEATSTTINSKATRTMNLVFMSSDLLADPHMYVGGGVEFLSLCSLFRPRSWCLLCSKKQEAHDLHCPIAPPPPALTTTPTGGRTLPRASWASHARRSTSLTAPASASRSPSTRCACQRGTATCPRSPLRTWRPPRGRCATPSPRASGRASARPGRRACGASRASPRA